MANTLKQVLLRETKLLFQLRKTERLWHIPVLALLCTGLPLLLGYYIGRVDYGVIACLGGLVILYLPSTTLKNRMITLLLCAFGFVLSFMVGIVFSFGVYLSVFVLGVFAFGINWVTNYFRLRPPGSFFFIMLASLAICMPFDLINIPTKIGLIALGVMFACVFALFYSLYITKKQANVPAKQTFAKSEYANLAESAIIGFFIGASLLVGRFFELDNPYWVPISCAAIMQGANVSHVWQRSVHRIAGTAIGMGLVWLFLRFDLSLLNICIIILVLQFIIEMLVVRHYALAVIFITPLTFFLAELGSGVPVQYNQVVSTRMIDIIIGSLIGLLGEWLFLRGRSSGQLAVQGTIETTKPSATRNNKLNHCFSYTTSISSIIHSLMLKS